MLQYKDYNISYYGHISRTVYMLRVIAVEIRVCSPLDLRINWTKWNEHTASMRTMFTWYFSVRVYVAEIYRCRWVLFSMYSLSYKITNNTTRLCLSVSEKEHLLTARWNNSSTLRPTRWADGHHISIPTRNYRNVGYFKQEHESHIKIPAFWVLIVDGHKYFEGNTLFLFSDLKVFSAPTNFYQKMLETCSSEMLVFAYKTTRYNNSENKNLKNHGRRNLEIHLN